MNDGKCHHEHSTTKLSADFGTYFFATSKQKGRKPYDSWIDSFEKPVSQSRKQQDRQECAQEKCKVNQMLERCLAIIDTSNSHGT